MAALAETAGPCSRAAALVGALTKAGIETATCAALDSNFKPVQGVYNYRLSVPMPLGMPPFIARHTFPLAQKTGISSLKPVHSFEEVLFLTGNLAYPYIKKSVSDIRDAIRAFDPDIVYSEFNISAMLAARLENRRLYATSSLPTRPEFASSPRFSAGLRRFLKECSLPPVRSGLELFSYADRQFVPSCEQLEPLNGAIYCGAWKKPLSEPCDKPCDRILVYMGSGTISPKKSLRVIGAAFAGRECEICFAGREYGQKTFAKGKATIHTAPYFDFGKLLPGSMLFINHGGQNSMTDGLLYGVPQLVCPGRVFERIYNARSLADNGAGEFLPPGDFTPEKIFAAADAIMSDGTYRANAAALGKTLLSLGGIDNVINAVRNDVSSGSR